MDGSSIDSSKAARSRFRLGRKLRQFLDGGCFHFGLRGRNGRSLCGNLRRAKQFFVGQASSTLEAAAQFGKTFGSARIAALTVNCFELRRKFRGAAIVAGTQHEIEQFFERRRVARRAAQNRFEQADRLLRQAVAREEIDVGERLRDKFLSFIVERRLNREP